MCVRRVGQKWCKEIEKLSPELPFEFPFSNFDFAVTFNPNLTFGTALERWKSLFHKNENIKDIRPHLQFECGVFEAVRVCNVQKFHLFPNIPEIKGVWGRVIFLIFSESVDPQLSNAMSYVLIEQNFAEISDNKVYWIFMIFKTLCSDSEILL